MLCSFDEINCYSNIGNPDEMKKTKYIRRGNKDPLMALIMACRDGQLGAVKSLCPVVNDVNGKLPGIGKKNIILWISHEII